MRKFKNYLLIALLGVCSFAFVNVVQAASIASKSMFVKNGQVRAIEMVCDPEAIEDGQTSTCYLIGVLGSASGDNILTSVNGFAVQLYTTKHLRFVSANVNTAIGTDKVNAVTYDVSQISQSTNVPSDAPDSMSKYKCYRGVTTNVAGKPVEALDYKCAVFYTKKNQSENAYTLNSLKNGASGIKTKFNPSMNGGSGMGLIGSFVVQLDNPSEAKECGEVCYMLWEIPTANDYDNSSCSTEADLEKEECKSVQQIYSCEEITLKPKTPTTPEDPEDPDTPNTGAFASYAVLAAGALIAIGAITMAKKNSKFNRI